MSIFLPRLWPVLSLGCLLLGLTACDPSGEPDPYSPYRVRVRLAGTGLAGLPVTAAVERLPLARGRQAQGLALPPTAAPDTIDLGPWNATEGVRLTLVYRPSGSGSGPLRLPAGSVLTGQILVNGKVKAAVRLDEQSATSHPAELRVSCDVARVAKVRGE